MKNSYLSHYLLEMFWANEIENKIEYGESADIKTAKQNLLDQLSCTDENVSFFERFDSEFENAFDLVDFTKTSIEILEAT
tara:strand:- start:376 stop:615 length:240 start_codon:yes stop_codon:yes gene_type:complete